MATDTTKDPDDQAAAQAAATDQAQAAQSQADAAHQTPDASQAAAASAQDTAATAQGSAAAAAPPSDATAGDQQQQQQQLTISGVRDYLKAQGIDASRYGDDTQVLSTLLEAARQGGRYRQIADEYTQLAPEFERWRYQQRQQPQVPQQQQQQPAQPKNLLERKPEWNDAWLAQVEQDPATGRIKARPGVNPDIARRVEDFAAWKQEWRSLLETDPAKAGEMMFAERLKSHVDEQLAQQQEINFAREFERTNQEWIYAKDAGGRQVIDRRTGQPALSPAGQMFLNFAVQGANLGIRGVTSQYQYAQNMLAAAIMQMQGAQPQQQQQPAAQPAKPASTNDTKKQALLNAARPNRNGATPANGTTQPDGDSGKGLRFGDRLAKAWAGKDDNYFSGEPGEED